MSREVPVAYVLGTFPQASQTFIAREIRGLRAHGVPLLVFALARRPADALEAADRGWYDSVRFAPLFLSPAVLVSNIRLLLENPARYLTTAATLIALPHRPRVLTLRAVALFMAGAWIARQITRAGGCRQVHAHFALAQAEVAMAVSGLLGVPFSFTAHARDIYATPSALEQKMHRAAVVVTCTGYNVDHLRRLCPDLPPEQVRLVHHGVDVAAASLVAQRRTTATSDARPLILAAGRLVEKKGFDTLVRACTILATRGVAFECRIVGEGPLATALQQLIASEALGACVLMAGWATSDALLQQMGRAAVFAMPSRVSRGGDRDGIPNVVLEAMAAGVPVVASAVSGIPEAVEDGKTGLLVPPDNPLALAEALERLLTDAPLAARLATAARARIDEEFTLDAASSRLAALFRVAPTE